MDDDIIGWLGRFGALRPFACLPAEIQGQAEREGTRGVTIDGRPYTQQAPRKGRTWRWPIDVGDNATLREIYAIEAGAYGPPPYRWYDPWAAEFNLLPANTAVPGLAFDLTGVWWDGSTTGVSASSTVETFDGLPVAYGVDLTGDGVLSAPAFNGDEDPVPVVPGRPYTFSVSGLKTGGDPWEVSLAWVDADQVQISTVTEAVAPDPEPQRAVVTGVAPPSAAGVLCEVSASAYETVRSLTMFQLTETDAATTWHTGLGAPRVSLPFGFDEVLIRVRGGVCDESRRGLPRLTVVEVG